MKRRRALVAVAASVGAMLAIAAAVPVPGGETEGADAAPALQTHEDLPGEPRSVASPVGAALLRGGTFSLALVTSVVFIRHHLGWRLTWSHVVKDCGGFSVSTECVT